MASPFSHQSCSQTRVQYKTWIRARVNRNIWFQSLSCLTHSPLGLGKVILFQDQRNTRDINQISVFSSVSFSHCCSACFAILFSLSLSLSSPLGVWGLVLTRHEALIAATGGSQTWEAREVFARSFPSPPFSSSSPLRSTLWTSWAWWRV